MHTDQAAKNHHVSGNICMYGIYMYIYISQSRKIFPLNCESAILASIYASAKGINRAHGTRASHL